ncbi:DoxX family protein [Pectobacteriaceae bacterium CE70]|uniref:DoxX family protein n=1 Tax=Serratia sp. (strain ATCC 39006) TaxID=104623 RepID=A0A2I5TI21_SERS3|nr:MULTISPECIES: DoxX family protein [Enterobacterales]WJV57209.1 DoxX family protein [Pectobacteriaceae bacterium C111]WJV61583.1 DoxX family protein [Pectobacteriaceae bacterium C52]WJV65858.1 DoxX family protein [Pectobacteriaceae bacterium CE70]WJY09877.1 DoxX family protein [Pectobacteriaceae bacterium C80]AUG99893.1 DoxX family protein [Serratia sp. ATCC 39006]
MISQANKWFSQLTDHPDAGKLLLRLTIGILLLFHGVAKIEHGVSWIVGMLQENGLPGFIAYGVYIGEVVVPVLIILGLFTRVAGAISAINLLVATLLVGMGRFFTITQVGAWGLEVEALYFLASLVIMLMGSGRYSITSNEDYR